MRQTFRNLYDLLEPRERRRALLLLVIILIMGMMEIAGVASIMPFVAVLADPSVVETNRYLAAVYDGLGFSSTRGFLIFLGIFVLFAVVGSTAFKALTSWAVLRFTAMRNYTLSRRLFEGYLNQPYSWFLGRHSADLGKNMLQEVTNVVNGALLPALQLVSQGVVILFLVTMLVIVDVWLALTVSVVLGGAYGLIYWKARRYLGQIGEDRVRANSERFRVSSEALGGIKDVKVLGLEEVFLHRFEKPSLRLAKHTAAHKMIEQLPQHALQAIAVVGILIIVQYQLVLRGDFAQSLPLIALYAVAGHRLLPALQQVYASTSQLRFAAPLLNAVHRDITETLPQPPKSSGGSSERLRPVRHNLELRGVCYRYPNATSRALESVNLTIAARTTVGFVGRTGAGKTTVVDVILGLLKPEEGELLVDGRPITEENRRAWQRCVGYVPQQIFLIDDTIARNVAFGVPPERIDFEAVERASRLANMHSFVTEELECGYATVIGERGVRLSGGQRQRIGIARALYRDPDVIIMDEATSALDNITERAVMDAVCNLGHQKTIVLIAHRLTTVTRSDQIFLFEGGRITDSGTYDQLVSGNDHFRKMVSSALR